MWHLTSNGGQDVISVGYEGDLRVDFRTAKHEVTTKIEN